MNNLYQKKMDCNVKGKFPEKKWGKRKKSGDEQSLTAAFFSFWGAGFALKKSTADRKPPTVV
jgi:hypothetical protein